MWWLLRHAFAVIVFPFTVVVLIPLWILRSRAISVALPAAPGEWCLLVLGVAFLLLGATLFVSCLRRFGVEGRGTLAPWDPPKTLVVRGAYAHVRNPMISGVVFVLLGEAAVLRSLPHSVWALLFIAINAAYIPLLEEPMLRARFGESYKVYCENVPRLIPRLRPWKGRAAVDT